MNPYIYASSRGRNLNDVNFRKRSIPGGKLKQQCEIAANDLVFLNGPKIVYFLAGIPDICTLVRDNQAKYEENFLNMSENHVDI